MSWVRKAAAFVAGSRRAMVWTAALGVCLLVLVVNAALTRVDPATPWGLAYGGVAAGLLVLACLYSVRRRLPRRGPLRAHAWLHIHVFAGTFFVLLVLMHSGFRLPAGPLGWALWVLTIWTGLSGAVGLFIQWWIPRALSSGLATELHYDRIPALAASIAERAEQVVATCSDAVRRYYADVMAPIMGPPRARLIYFVDVTGGLQGRIRDFDYLGRFADADEGQRLAELRALMTAKVDADAHYTLQRVLRWWLYGHVPLVGLLLILVTIHVVSILYY
jgi:hypothetical protein